MTEPYAPGGGGHHYKPEILALRRNRRGPRSRPGFRHACAGLTADCTGLAVRKDQHLLMTQPAFGGNIMATIVCRDHRRITTVEPASCSINPVDSRLPCGAFAVKGWQKGKNGRILEGIKNHLMTSRTPKGAGFRRARHRRRLRYAGKSGPAGRQRERACVDAGRMLKIGSDRQDSAAQPVYHAWHFAPSAFGDMESRTCHLAINKGAPIFDVADFVCGRYGTR